jgi:hypothetical protein
MVEVRGTGAEVTLKSLLKTGQRSVATVEGCPRHLRPLLDLSQRRTEAPRPTEGVEGHSVLALEPAAHTLWAQTTLPQITIFPATGRVLLEIGQQRSKPRRWVAGCFEGPTTFAGAIAR